MTRTETEGKVETTDRKRRRRRLASTLAYLLNPVWPVWVLSSRRYRSAFVELHAWNALYLFSAWVLLWLPASTVLILAARVVRPPWGPLVAYLGTWMALSGISALAAAFGGLWKVPVVTRLAFRQCGVPAGQETE